MLQIFVMYLVKISIKIEKEDIKEITIHEVNNQGSWLLYYYTEIILKNGNSIILTCLLVSQSKIKSVLRAKSKMKYEFFPIIKKEKRQHITAHNSP